MKTGAQQMYKAISISFLLLLICRYCFAGPASEPTLFGEWTALTNNPVQALSLRARLVISETADISGSRTAKTYVEFENTNNDIQNLYVHSSFRLNCELRDSSGKIIPAEWIPLNILFPIDCWLAIQGDSILRCRPFPRVSIKASEGKWGITAGGNYWRLPVGAANDYYLAATLNLTVPKGETPPLPHFPTVNDSIFTNIEEMPLIMIQGTFKLPPVKIPAKSLSGR